MTISSMVPFHFISNKYSNEYSNDDEVSSLEIRLSFLLFSIIFFSLFSFFLYFFFLFLFYSLLALSQLLFLSRTPLFPFHSPGSSAMQSGAATYTTRWIPSPELSVDGEKTGQVKPRRRFLFSSIPVFAWATDFIVAYVDL